MEKQGGSKTHASTTIKKPETNVKRRCVDKDLESDDDEDTTIFSSIFKNLKADTAILLAVTGEDKVIRLF